MDVSSVFPGWLLPILNELPYFFYNYLDILKIQLLYVLVNNGILLVSIEKISEGFQTGIRGLFRPEMEGAKPLA